MAKIGVTGRSTFTVQINGKKAIPLLLNLHLVQHWMMMKSWRGILHELLLYYKMRKDDPHLSMIIVLLLAIMKKVRVRVTNESLTFHPGSSSGG